MINDFRNSIYLIENVHHQIEAKFLYFI